MSRDLPRSTALQAGLAAALVIGVLMLLIVSGHNKEVRSEVPGEASSVVPARDLEDGMRSIASDEFFETVTDAQREAGTWSVVSVSDQDGRSMAPAVQEVSLVGDEPATRTSFDSATGTIEAVLVGENFYIKGFTAGTEPWWKVGSDDASSRVIQALVPQSDPTEFLASHAPPKKFEVLGVEEIEVLASPEQGQDPAESAPTTKTVHYRMTIDAVGEKAPGVQGEPESGGTPMQMDMWVDEQNRPVRVETVLTADGGRFTTRLYYGLYGSEVSIEEPAADQVTTTPPKELEAALSGTGSQ